MKIRILYFTLFLLISATAIMAAEVVKDGNHYKSVIQKQFDVTPGGTLQIKDIQGDIDISSWTKNEIEITITMGMDVYTMEEARERASRFEADIKQSGNMVTINGRGDYRHENMDYKVTVPREFNMDVSTSSGDIEINEITGKVSAATSGGDIELNDIKGVISVATSGGDMEFTKIDGPIKAVTSGGDIEINHVIGEANLVTSGGDITVYDAAKDIDLATSGGDVEAAMLAGNIQAHTSGGDMAIADCKGTAKLNTSGGDIDFKNMTGKVTANTSGGSISGMNLQDGIVTRTSGGDIDLAQVSGDIDGITSGGDINVVITQKDFSKSHRVNLATTGGDIELAIPENMPCSITATIKLNGDKAWRRYDIMSDFPLTKSQSDDGESIVSKGDINGGGDPVTLEVKNGNITIHKTR